jgi:hypothetical protein
LSEFPLFYKEKELSELDGSHFKDDLKMLKEKCRARYWNVYINCTEFRKFSLTDFMHVMALLNSRMFGFNINGIHKAAMVPLASFCNHNDPPAANWSFDNERKGFLLKAAIDIPKEKEISISYG